MDKSFNYAVAARTLALLDERRARLYPDQKSFYVWCREDRIVIIFDPQMIDIGKVNEDFAHRLSTRLQGRRVVRTNSRGLFLQVGYNIPPALVELEAKPLNLSVQPTPFHLPVGISHDKEIWISLLEGDSFFVVGVRGMGKSAELHAFIQALLHGGQTLVYAWDGKDNAEYLRYVGRDNFTLMPMNGLQAGLRALQVETTARLRKLALSGHPNIISFNKTASEQDFMKPIALVIDEVAEVEDQELLLKHVKVNRAAGVYPIFATNDPSKAAVVAKSNLSTRISFHVLSSWDSITGFGRPGANKLPKEQGRGLIVHEGRVVEFQSFLVEYPKPTEAAIQWLVDSVDDVSVPTAPESLPATAEPVDEIAQMAELIRAQWTSDMSGRQVAKLLGLSQYGGSLKTKTDKVIAYLTATTPTATTTENQPQIGILTPEMA